MDVVPSSYVFFVRRYVLNHVLDRSLKTGGRQESMDQVEGVLDTQGLLAPDLICESCHM